MKLEIRKLFLLQFMAVWFVFVPKLANATPFEFEVSGRITQYTDPQKKIFRVSQAHIQKLKKYSIKTATSWTNAENFSGVRVVDILKLVGATGKQLKIIALDKYTHTVPVQEMITYQTIFAYERNGKIMDLQHLGPFALIYPRDLYAEELQKRNVDAKTVWQIKHVIVQ